VTRVFLILASILAGSAVILGAFASHALKAKLTSHALAIWEIGTKYQMYHALALCLVALWLSRTEINSTPLVAAGFAFITGITLFSGSLYALSLSDLQWLGTITPVGGLAFIVGWICVAVAAWSFK
jgi:uncharacterized membrane protein YgdD (TMEM256/DUF423 family)